jgi:hypothetical protein
MSVATSNSAPPTTPVAPVDAGQTRIWRSGGGRRVVLAFVFLLLLPFYGSLGPMLFQRASRGLVGDSLALLLLALAFTALMLLILQQLVHAVRARVALDASGVTLTVPVVSKRGPFFLFRYDSREIPYGQIAGVETRSEVYGGSLAPILLKATRLNMKDGQSVVLGYVNANEVEAQMPYPDIGQAIAARAGVAMKDQGVVHRSMQRRMLGIVSPPEENARVSETEIASLNRAHTRNLRVLVGCLALLVIGGIALDFATASRASYAEMGAGMANPARGAQPAPKRR